MSDPYIGEIRMFGGNFAPLGWLFCQGQLLNISDYDVLFNLVGTTYGGNGQTNFALPNLQSRVAIHQGPDSQGNTYTLGQTGGLETVTLTTNQMPSHSHPMVANGNANSGTTTSGTGAFFGAQANAADTVYNTSTVGTTALGANGIGPSNGGGQPHGNVKPFLCVNFIIATQGIYPSQS